MEDSVEDQETEPSFNLLYPELMSVTELISILEQRYIQNEDLKSLSKEGLIELYYSYVLPLPQRKYRMNRRGREMTKKQIIMAKKRKIERDKSDDSEPPLKKSGLVSSFNISTGTGDRIKPPPSCIDFSKKKIFLTSKTKPVQSLSGQLADTYLNSDNKETQNSDTVRRNIVKITLNSSSSENSMETNSVKPKKIKLNSGQKSPSDASKKLNMNSPTSPNKVTNFQTTVNLINKHIGGKTEGISEKSGKKHSETNPGASVTETEGNDSPKKKAKLKKIFWP